MVQKWGIPSKIQEPTLQNNIRQVDNNDLRKENFLLTKENRENALIQIESQKIMVHKTYNNCVKYKNVNVVVWILYKAMGNKVETTYVKFLKTQEGPYHIYEITLGGLYQIESQRRKEELSWNGEHLKKYYM